MSIILSCSFTQGCLRLTAWGVNVRCDSSDILTWQSFCPLDFPCPVCWCSVCSVTSTLTGDGQLGTLLMGKAERACNALQDKLQCEPSRHDTDCSNKGCTLTLNQSLPTSLAVAVHCNEQEMQTTSQATLTMQLDVIWYKATCTLFRQTGTAINLLLISTHL